MWIFTMHPVILKLEGTPPHSEKCNLCFEIFQRSIQSKTFVKLWFSKVRYLIDAPQLLLKMRTVLLTYLAAPTRSLKRDVVG